MSLSSGIGFHKIVKKVNLYHVGTDESYHKRQMAPKSPPIMKILPIEVPAISFEELKEVTKNFDADCLIGEGSYGRVYYGVFKSGQTVGIKKLDASKQSDDEFLSQVLLTTLIQVVVCYLKLVITIYID